MKYNVNSLRGMELIGALTHASQVVRGIVRQQERLESVYAESLF